MDNLSFEVKIPIYNITVIFYIGDNLFEMSKIIKKKHQKQKNVLTQKESKEIDGVNLLQFLSENLLYILIHRENGLIKVSSITHEIFHATAIIAEENNFRFCKDEEAFAIINGFLNSMVLKKVIECGEKLFYDENKYFKMMK